ncbi:MAG: ABC transporter ATP-binding protein [Bacteroidota bacterium]
MNMISNIRYAFRFDQSGIRKAFLWEFLHGILIAAPSGILLIIIWELFKESPDLNTIWITLAVMGGLFLLQLYVAQKAMISSNEATYEMSRRIRLALGNKLQRLSLGYYKKRDPGELAAVVLQDVANFENIFGHSVTNIANAVFGTLILSSFLLWLNWTLGLSLLAALVLAIPLIQLSKWLVEKYGSKTIAARNTTGARFLEYVQGIQHIKSYGMTGARFQSLKQALSDLRRESIRTEAIPGPFILTVGVLLEVCFVLMIWLALYMLSQSTLTIPVLIAFLILGYRLYEPLKILMVEYPILSYMNLSLSRVISVLEAEEQTIGQDLVPSSFGIEFDQVSFSYVEERQVMNQLSFTAAMGTMTALVGPSGSGKTTITSLIARFWDVSEGVIRIGGIPLTDMAAATAYTLISEVFQEVYLFDDSIYNNILIGNPLADEKQVLEAAKKAQIMEFTDDLPDGLDSLVGEGGSKLSGGQKQRISIARALLKDAPIILLDEATASLDPENEIYIQQAIQELVRDKTVIVIAHKLATIQQADQILVLDKGHIVESGTHDVLLDQKGLYARLWHTQQQASGWKITTNKKIAEAAD